MYVYATLGSSLHRREKYNILPGLFVTPEGWHSTVDRKTTTPGTLNGEPEPRVYVGARR
jgi:hypothetical protein